MTHDISLIVSMTGGFAAALLFGYLTHRLNLSPILGYLLAGIAVGPHTPGFVADPHLATQLAEIGVILLMFGVGLHFHVEDLLKVRRIAIPGALAQIAVATGLGLAAAQFFGWGWQAGVVYGLAVSVASTVVLTRVLVDNHALHTSTGHIAIGWLIVEDIFTVLVLVMLPVLAAGGGDSFLGLGSVFGITFAKIAALIVLTFWLGGRVIPWLFVRMSSTRSRELFTLTVLVTVLGLAVGSTKLFGVSMALGAFLAGMVIGKTEFGLRAASEALPFSDAFAVLFFVSVGMLFDPSTVVTQFPLVAATIAIVLVGKTLAAFAIVLLLNYPLKTALGVAIALAQIGEFSFIVGALGRQLGLLPQAALDILVATAMVTITLNPLLYRAIPRMEKWFARFSSLSRSGAAISTAALPPHGSKNVSPTSQHQAVIVGYGPVGRTVSRILKESGIESTIIELNLDVSRRLASEGIRVVYGDASREEVLRQAGVSQAGTLILAASNLDTRPEIARIAKELNPEIQILGRTAYVREMNSLKNVPRENIFSGEAEVALALTEKILRTLGATPEQIDRERRRVRDELGAPPP